MNSSNSMGDNHLGEDGNSIGSISRSGRVRKKNSLLADYDSPDVIEKRGRKPNNINKGANNARSHGKSQSNNNNNNKSKKLHVNHKNASYTRDAEVYSPIEMVHESMDDEDGEVPDINEEELIDEGLLDQEDGATELTNNVHHIANNVCLKSAAQSTYFLEKSFSKQRKIPSAGQNSGTKVKATRKDKGSPRVTAYMLWAKEQRAIFANKYPHLDFSTVSKKLSDLWATVPQNQKRMWKTKAAKIMKKKANGSENIKNSGGPSLVLAKPPTIPQRKGMKNTTPEESLLPKRPPGRPSKKGTNFLKPTVGTTAQESSSKYVINHNDSSSTGSRGVGHLKKQPALAATPSHSSTAIIKTGPVLSAVVSDDDDIKPEPYKFQVTASDPLSAAAHLSLLGENLKKLGAEMQSKKLTDQSVNESLSYLLDSLVCSVGPILCLTQMVPELNCIPEEKLKKILDNVGYIMPGL